MFKKKRKTTVDLMRVNNYSSTVKVLCKFKDKYCKQYGTLTQVEVRVTVKCERERVGNEPAKSFRILKVDRMVKFRCSRL